MVPAEGLGLGSALGFPGRPVEAVAGMRTALVPALELDDPAAEIELLP